MEKLKKVIKILSKILLLIIVLTCIIVIIGEYKEITIGVIAKKGIAIALIYAIAKTKGLMS